jgi:hypothetical protein
MNTLSFKGTGLEDINLDYVHYDEGDISLGIIKNIDAIWLTQTLGLIYLCSVGTVLVGSANTAADTQITAFIVGWCDTACA